MKILIVTLHVNESAQAIPLAAGNLKAALPEIAQKNTKLIELYPGQQAEHICTELLSEKPDLVAFSVYVWSRSLLLDVAHKLKQLKPELITVAGGPEASADSLAVIEQGNLNAVLRGEGEESFAALVNHTLQNKSLENIPGLVQPEQPEPLADQTYCPDLSQLPSPWLTSTLPLTEGCGVLWEVARGCSFNCAFCYDAKGQKGVRPLPVARLKAELELFHQRQVSQVWVLDSTFNAPPERGQALLRLLRDTAPEIHYHIEAKADFLDQETANLLAQLSCSVQIGLQATDPQVLKPLHRNINESKMAKRLKLLSEAGVTFGLDLIYGLPHDNHQGFMKSLDFALTQQPNQLDIFPLAVLPGTEIFDHQERFGVRAEKQPPYAIISNQSYSDEERQLSQKLALATNIFYNRGRAVGFFLQLCQLVKMAPSQLLSHFSTWLEEHYPELSKNPETVLTWWPKDILPCQIEFSKLLLQQKRLSACQKLLEDLIHYHYFCAEMVIAPNCEPIAPSGNHRTVTWQRNPHLYIHRFNHPLEDIEAYGGENIKKIAGMLSKEKEYVIFLRQNEEVIIEALHDDFARMLLQADGSQNLAELGRKHSRVQREEVDFAIDQGLLIPA